MKIMLMTAAIAISLGTTTAYGASTLESSTIAIEKTDAIAETRSTFQKIVTKNGITCFQRGRTVTCVRMTP